MPNNITEDPAERSRSAYMEELDYVLSVLTWRGARKSLANYLGVSSSQITSYLRGDVIPSADKYVSIQKFLTLPRVEQRRYMHPEDETT